MLAASFLAIFLVPAIFYLIEKWSGAGKKDAAAAAPPLPPTPEPAPGD
jgi:hypothetical protein